LNADLALQPEKWLLRLWRASTLCGMDEGERHQDGDADQDDADHRRHHAHPPVHATYPSGLDALLTAARSAPSEAPGKVIPATTPGRQLLKGRRAWEGRSIGALHRVMHAPSLFVRTPPLCAGGSPSFIQRRMQRECARDEIRKIGRRATPVHFRGKVLHGRMQRCRLLELRVEGVLLPVLSSLSILHVRERCGERGQQRRWVSNVCGTEEGGPHGGMLLCLQV